MSTKKLESAVGGCIFTLKIHDFWKLQSRDIHSQTEPLILYNHDFWKHRLVIDAIE